jgi:hypothetical protein
MTARPVSRFYPRPKPVSIFFSGLAGPRPACGRFGQTVSAAAPSAGRTLIQMDITDEMEH